MILHYTEINFFWTDLSLRFNDCARPKLFLAYVTLRRHFDDVISNWFLAMAMFDKYLRLGAGLQDFKNVLKV